MDKEILIEKIASSVGINDTQNLNKKNAALKVASQMLKLAAENQRQLDAFMENQ